MFPSTISPHSSAPGPHVIGTIYTIMPDTVPVVGSSFVGRSSRSQVRKSRFRISPRDAHNTRELNLQDEQDVENHDGSVRTNVRKRGQLVEASDNSGESFKGSRERSLAKEQIPKHKKVHFPAIAAKELVRKQTGVIYDVRMFEHRNPWDNKHPERPQRYTAIMTRCSDLGLLHRCMSIPPRYAVPEEVTSVHTATHAVLLKVISAQCKNNLDFEEFAEGYNSVYFNATCNSLALLACGSTIDLVKNVAEGKIQNGMAIVRPPGHNAMKEEFSGYCYFNNVAIAAKQVLNSGLAKRILIVDFDVRHGQATQRVFYDDPRVLYLSTHRYENGLYWPNLEESNFNWIGVAKGMGYNCNIPLNQVGIGNTEFITIWHKLLLPIAYQFNPDLVIVSAGFNAALGCPEGEMTVSPQCYPHLIWPLMGLANGKVAVVLEGGYCLKSLAEAAALTMRALLGDPCPMIPKISNPDPKVVASILNITTMLQRIWRFGSSSFLSEKDFRVQLKSGNAYMPTCRYDFKGPDLRPYNYPTRGYYAKQSRELAQTLDKELDKQISGTSLTVAKHRVGLLYDEAMLEHRNMRDLDHVEAPSRIQAIYERHIDYGLLKRCLLIHGVQATAEDISRLHDFDHVIKMKGIKNLSKNEAIELEESLNSIFLNTNTYDASCLAAGCVITAVMNVMDERCQSAVAIVRPPGHHAEKNEAMGFCIFNNVAIGAKYALDKYKLLRVLIIDWDIHHGNGIQNMFEDDPRVLYISLHRYEGGKFFPFSKIADYDKVGIGPGKGFNVNIPWNNGKMGDAEYMAAFTSVILPIAYEFAPELVLVAAGFDATEGDPLGQFLVTPECYAHMTHLLMPLANGKLIMALEGGYDLDAISYCMTLCTKALLGDPLPTLHLKKGIKKTAHVTIQRVLEVQSEYWTVLKPFQQHLPMNCPISRGVYPKPEQAKSDEEEIVEEVQNVNGINRRTWRIVRGQNNKMPRMEERDKSPDSTVEMKMKMILDKGQLFRVTSTNSGDVIGEYRLLPMDLYKATTEYLQGDKFRCQLETCVNHKDLELSGSYSSSDELLLQHYDRYHNPDQPRRCPSCQKFFVKQLDLNRHSRTCLVSILDEQISKLQI